MERTRRNILGKTAKRLTTRRRTARRGAKRSEVTSDVRQPGLATPILGCEKSVFKGSLLEEVPEVDIKVTRQEKEILMAQARKKMEQLPQLVIDRISYTMFSPEELRERALYRVTKTDDHGLHTVNDPRGGVVDNDKVCLTCMKDNLECPGHYGIIELNQHIVHPLFRREVVDVLTAVCNSCGGLLLPEDTIESKGLTRLTGSKRLRAIAEESKKLHCLRSEENIKAGVAPCEPNPTYRTAKVKEFGKIFYSYKEGKENERTVEDIEKILDAISDEDAKLLGFSGESHPRRFVMKVLPVIPVCARAPVIQDGMLLKDDITTMYLEIVRYNQDLLKEEVKTDEKKRQDVVNSLIFAIEHLIDNADGKYRQGKTKPYRDIKGRVQGKEAIIRSAIMGKRVNYSARTPIGPDPNLKFGQIRIPRVMAQYLTYPETVSASNIGRLTRLFKAGQVTHLTPEGGKWAGRRLKVTDKIKEVHRLRYGDVVDRWLQTGDQMNPANFVAFNRQPTLHKQGIMGYEVVLGDPMTIGLHLSYTTPHNADFDGDEGNLHAPQSREVAKELATIMNVKSCIMNAQDNKNIIGVVYDALTGAYLLTQPETFVEPDVFMNIVSFLENTEGLDTLDQRLEKYSIPKTSGRALFSAILPPDLYYRKNDVLIREGILVSGVITKGQIGTTHGSLIQVLMKDYGQDVTVNFLTDIYNIMREWLDVRGFSVGLDDCFLQGDHPEREIEYEVQRAKMLVKSMGWKMEDPLEEERRENQIIAYLNTAKGLGARISEKNLAPGNAFNVMAKSGAKGSTFNIAQITGILGQQFVQGQRMPETISGGRRCLPYFPEDSIDPAARGFCNNSFLSGLTPAEMFFHQSGGREGLTDTAIKSVTGDTPIIISENGKTRRVNIGDWIDERMGVSGVEIEYHEDRDMELLKLSDEVTIPTVDLDGEVTWGKITAITRHDPGKELYKVKTLGGRKVIVTESHSLLIWDHEEKKFQRKSTPEVKVGDFVPTTMDLSPPDDITISIDMGKYLPRSEYIYGTDFLTAKEMVVGFDKGNRSPAGWWDKNNGTTFTLPYKHTHSMLRVVRRSNISYIKPNYIYPYKGKRIETYIPDSFPLDRENGFFIGLFLAEGDADVKGGAVRISNNDPTILKLVQTWFEKYNMKWEVSTRKNKAGGTSTTIRGFSTVMASFLINLVGTGAANKRIPDEAYSAPESFIIGLLDGYISGDGTVTRNAIEGTSCSKKLIEGISFLTSRLGVFTKMSRRHMPGNNFGTVNIKPIYSLSIRGQWATRFQQLVKLSLPYKQTKLEELVGSAIHRNFPQQEDVVLDKIVSIKPIDVKLYPKVYDLTVPSTLNFGLANGMHVVDTAETGHMHHKVVKALEDIKVYEDGSARNAFGLIFQEIYGEDGFDAAMLETVSTKTGTFTSFINTKRLAGRINAKYGYSTPGEPEPQTIVPVPSTVIKEDKEGIDFPPVPPLSPTPEGPSAIEIGDVVELETGQGVVKQIDGERLLVQREGANPEWVKIGKLLE